MSMFHQNLIQYIILKIAASDNVLNRFQNWIEEHDRNKFKFTILPFEISISPRKFADSLVWLRISPDFGFPRGNEIIRSIFLFRRQFPFVKTRRSRTEEEKPTNKAKTNRFPNQPRQAGQKTDPGIGIWNVCEIDFPRLPPNQARQPGPSRVVSSRITNWIFPWR